ncbi:hypothetical protein V2J09_011752 [Rumex salicifolius]
MSSRGDHHTVPLSVLLSRETKSEKIENPDIIFGQANQSKKGEDFTLLKTECERHVGDGVTEFSAFGYWGRSVAVRKRERVTASGGEVGRLNTGGGTEIGPLRCWPGGLCLSRSIGDRDVGEFIVPVPYVKQIKLSTAGGRLIIASDGVWDAISFETAFDCCRGMPPEPAAAQIEAVQFKGLRDDTTCIVVDLFQAEKSQPPLPAPKKQGKGVFKHMFKKKYSESSSLPEKDYAEPDLVEEMFEEGSAMLSERLDTKYPLCNMFKLFTCAICQVEIKPGDGVSIHADSSSNRKTRPWDGPFLCESCQEKKEAMEGRRPSGDRYSSGSD